jgi:hypothetical protein
MAKDKMNEEVMDENEPVEEVLKPEPLKVSAKAKKSPEQEEVEFLSPYGGFRPPQQGEFVERVENLFVVVMVEDGKKYSIPYVHELHKDLVKGDAVTF